MARKVEFSITFQIVSHKKSKENTRNFISSSITHSVPHLANAPENRLYEPFSGELAKLRTE